MVFPFQVALGQSEAASPRQRAGAGRHTRRFGCLLVAAPWAHDPASNGSRRSMWRPFVAASGAVLSRVPVAAATAAATASRSTRRFDGGRLQQYQQLRQTVVATSSTAWTSWSHWVTRRRSSTFSSSKWGAAPPSCQSWIMWVTAAAHIFIHFFFVSVFIVALSPVFAA